MFLTQKLGERYLWVDALCIVQDVDVVRQQSIENMDRIYAQSLCTIVAGTCKDANEHLPGVTQKTQWTQFLEPVSRSLTLSAHFDYKDHLEATKYNQRAWTFQEFQLAHRLLIFAPNNQTYFSCASAVYSEEVEPGPTLDHDMCMLDGMHSLKLSPGKNHIWSTYQRAVRNLTSRHMSHERDILNAFAGILRRICPERSIEGLAVPIFDLALLWQPRERLRRRTGFSSWAWAGWMGRVGWFDDGALSAFADASACETQQVGEWTRARAWIVWYSSWGTNIMSAAYLLDGPPWLRGSAPGREIQEERFRGLSTGNFAPRPDMIPRRLRGLERQRRHIRYLQFWTVSVYFQIELNDAAVLRWKSFQPESTGDGLRLFLLRDRFDEACGWVLLDEGWVEKGKTSDIRNQEFILLSEGSSPRDEGNNEEVEDETGGGIDDREFNTMMITWIDGIAERAGVGRVRRTALANSCWRDMKWKEIVLG
ncbi:hypothetical protein EJ04DRAFT_505854 [Polyplosphaeria fusca]|uniref:Heterokaryon incompatibility domain-containing protein n=1 Tax=Polyplosphaeria fusca TaxID=682080 RepID=A0A9P4QKG4_9PLEO|nr:hypothetical protein EJ04DRAFT_505854 [Polyplosphaeria fusca]